jgi:ATP-dependent DNA helicase PIF1
MTIMRPLELSKEFKEVLDAMEKTPANLFITGKAGTGKSTLLQLFRNTTRKKAIFLAPTGIAALNIQGQTIHSFFGFPPKPIAKQDIKPRRAKKLYQNIEVMVVDEISMVRADMLDNMDYFLRLNRNNMAQPFGGVQVFFFGDLFQLPPVVSSEEERFMLQMRYSSPYFFSAEVFPLLHMQMVELTRIYRQEERLFIRLLNSVRLNNADMDDLCDLNERHLPQFDAGDGYITLSARNAQANDLNIKKLRDIPFSEQTYISKVTGDFPPTVFPTEPILKLKEGAQIMFVKNDPQRQFVNGTIGRVHALTPDSIKVSVEEEGKPRLVEVEKATWEVLQYKANEKDGSIETSTVGTFEQFPLKLAWAITIHKSQGKTFDRVVIDLGKGAFEHGQTYVALSRCRTLGGIVLRQPIRPSDIMTDERVIDFYKSEL